MGGWTVIMAGKVSSTHHLNKKKSVEVCLMYLSGCIVSEQNRGPFIPVALTATILQLQ
jgi:hypothetical protein